jgi:hypothetical protein
VPDSDAGVHEAARMADVPEMPKEFALLTITKG